MGAEDLQVPHADASMTVMWVLCGNDKNDCIGQAYKVL